MKFVEKNRTVEPHAESILYVYLQDGNGVPVAGKKIKIYAGPPPTGEPSYFVDDDPNSPNRRTDAGGKFQFIVENGAPRNTLDFFVQVLGNADGAESSPIHMPFPERQAQWVIVTLADEDESEPAGDDGIPPSSIGLSDLMAPPPMAPEGMPEELPEPFPAVVPEEVTVLSATPEAAPEPVVQPTPEPEPLAQPTPQPVAEAAPQATPQPVIPVRTPQPQAALMGTVRGRVSNAPAGARLVLRSPSRTLDALVASDGLYSFNNVPVGVYTLELAGIGVINPTLTVAVSQTTVFDYPSAPQAPIRKVLKHYLLFGPGTQPGTLTNLILALDYIVHFTPVVGFSVEEAMSAERVTIVGGTSAVSSQDELRLRDGGSHVARLQAPDSYALENMFQQLLASGSPYVS